MATELKNKVLGHISIRFEEIVDGIVEGVVGEPEINIGDTLETAVKTVAAALAPYGDSKITLCTVTVDATTVVMVDGAERRGRSTQKGLIRARARHE